MSVTGKINNPTLRLHIILGQFADEVVFGLADGVADFEQRQVFFADDTPIEQVVPINERLPEFRAKEHHGDILFRFARLDEREHLKKFVERAKAAGERDERLGQVEEPVFAHEEVVELEGKLGRAIGIHRLLVRQADAQAKGRAAGFFRAAVGGFHDAGTAARADGEALRRVGDGLRPLRQLMRQFAGLFIIRRGRHVFARAVDLRLLVAGNGGLFANFGFERGEFRLGDIKGLQPGGAEKDEGVFNMLAAQTAIGLGHLTHYADEAAFGAGEKSRVVVRLERPACRRRFKGQVVLRGHEGN